jgi:hypothetical protein
VSDELPPDPDLDDLPDEVANESGSMRVRAVDPDTGESVEQAITRDEIAAAFPARRLDDGRGQ